MEHRLAISKRRVANTFHMEKYVKTHVKPHTIYLLFNNNYHNINRLIKYIISVIANLGYIIIDKFYAVTSAFN